MRKINLFLSFILAFSSSVLGQYSTDWIKPAESYQKSGVMMARDNQDNAIATGYWTNNNVFTRKYDKFGVLQWEAISASGIQSEYERPNWVTTDNSNNVFVAGYRYAGASVPVAIIILKYSPDGELMWKKVVSPVNYLVGMSLRCEVDNNGNLYAGATGVGGQAGFALIKLDTNGTIVFTQHSAANAPGFFESMRIKGNKIVLSASGGVPAGGDPNIASVAVWDTTGTLLWTAGVQGRGGKDVEIDDAGNVYLLTSFSNQVSPTSQMDIVLYKFDPAGIQLWKKDFDFGGGADFSARFTYVASKLSIIGQSQSLDAWITFQLDTDGTMLWNTVYNGAPGFEEAPYFIAAKANGEVFVTGKGGPHVDPFNVPSLRMITLKYSNTGEQKWVDSTNIYSGWGYACAIASDNSLYALSGTNMTVFHFLDHTGTGSCSIPTGLTVANIADNLATFSWTSVPGATLYHLRYRPATAATWTVVSFDQTTMNIYGLYAGTNYEYAIEAVCSNGPSGYSATQTFATTGTAICTSVGQSQAQEYLSQLWIQGGMINNSGSNNGYGDFTNLISPFTRGQLVQGYISGLVPYPEFEYYTIWIDYNHDNDFTDAGEEVVTLYSDFSGFNAFSFTIPETAPLGLARMRVVMSHDSAPAPCGVYSRGETEDYTVQINDTSTVPPPVPAGLSVSNVTNSSATFTWTPENSASSYQLRYKKTTDASWTIAPVNTTSITVPALTASTLYNFSCQAIGSIGSSGYGAAQSFSTLGIALPMNAVELKTSRQAVNVLLTWTSESEQNSDRFEIERSVDGINYSKTGQVQAAGFSTDLRRYRFIDSAVAKSRIFYRLKLIDMDGLFKFSAVSIVAAVSDLNPGFSMYPNPASSRVQIAFTEPVTKTMQLKVFSQSGQLIKWQQVSAGTPIISMDVSGLTKGYYSVVISGGVDVMVRKLIVN